MVLDDPPIVLRRLRLACNKPKSSIPHRQGLRGRKRKAKARLSAPSDPNRPRTRPPTMSGGRRRCKASARSHPPAFLHRQTMPGRCLCFRESLSFLRASAQVLLHPNPQLGTGWLETCYSLAAKPKRAGEKRDAGERNSTRVMHFGDPATRGMFSRQKKEKKQSLHRAQPMGLMQIKQQD